MSLTTHRGIYQQNTTVIYSWYSWKRWAALAPPRQMEQAGRGRPPEISGSNAELPESLRAAVLPVRAAGGWVLEGPDGLAAASEKETFAFDFDDL